MVDGAVQDTRQAPGIEDVVAQDQRDAVAVDKLLPDEERLGNAVGLLLHGVGDVQPQLVSIAQQLLKYRHVPDGGDDEDLPDAGQHQCGQWIVDHGLVVDGKDLLGDRPRQGIQTCAGAAGQNDSLHIFLSSRRIIYRLLFLPNSMILSQM